MRSCWFDRAKKSLAERKGEIRLLSVRIFIRITRLLYYRGTFARNSLLKVLNLSHNKIRKLDSNTFRGMRFLIRLYLSDNQINDVGRGTFGPVTRIGTIDLARNFIKKIDFQMFNQLQFAEVRMHSSKFFEIEEDSPYILLFFCSAVGRVRKFRHRRRETFFQGSLLDKDRFIPQRNFEDRAGRL